MSALIRRLSVETSVVESIVRSMCHHYVSLLLCNPFNLVLLSIFRALVDPLRAVPRPFLARCTRLWLFRGFASKQWLKINQELHQTYGPVVRVAPGEYSINDAEANKIVYSHGSKFPKVRVFLFPSGTGADKLTSYDAVRLVHNIQRQKGGLVRNPRYGFPCCASPQAARRIFNVALVAYEPYINECVTLYKKQPDRIDGETIDLTHWNHGFPFDAIGMITFSYRFGFLDTGRDEVAFMSAIPRNSRNNILIGVYPIVFPHIHSILGMFYGQKVADKVRQYVQGQMGNAKRQIQEEKEMGIQNAPESKGEPQDFISKLLRMEQDPENRKGITDEDVALAAATNLGAGSDTTAITATAILYFVAKYPHVLEKLREELQEAAGASGSKDEALIPFAVTKKLPYLQAVIKEAVRVHHASGVPMPRVVPAGGAVLCGKYFPQGSVVGANAWVTHRDEAVWGSDGAVFDPDRWKNSESTPAEIQYLSWGQGSRVCIGRNIAEQQLYILIPALIMRYDFELTTECKLNLFTDSAIFARPDVHATLRRRK